MATLYIVRCAWMFHLLCDLYMHGCIVCSQTLYINHVGKATQWHHPEDTAAAARKKNREAQRAMSKTVGDPVTAAAAAAAAGDEPEDGGAAKKNGGGNPKEKLNKTAPLPSNKGNSLAAEVAEEEEL